MRARAGRVRVSADVERRRPAGRERGGDEPATGQRNDPAPEPAEDTSAKVVDLMEALEASVSRAKSGRKKKATPRRKSA